MHNPACHLRHLYIRPFGGWRMFDVIPAKASNAQVGHAGLCIDRPDYAKGLIKKVRQWFRTA